MTGRDGDGISDAQLDRALRTMLARDDAAVDLRARVLASIDAQVTPARTAWRLGAAPAIGVAAMLILIVALAIWSAGRREDARTKSADGAGASAAPDTTERARPRHQARSSATSPGEVPDTRRATRRARAVRLPAVDRSVGSWGAALPPLDLPEPITVGQLDEPPMQVVRLSIERLTIDPLEVGPLDRSPEE